LQDAVRREAAGDAAAELDRAGAARGYHSSPWITLGATMDVGAILDRAWNE
jgi:hypothetical protein